MLRLVGDLPNSFLESARLEDAIRANLAGLGFPVADATHPLRSQNATSNTDTHQHA